MVASQDVLYAFAGACRAYVSMLNRLLPPDIRVLGATVVPPSFDARYAISWYIREVVLYRMTRPFPSLHKEHTTGAM